MSAASEHTLREFVESVDDLIGRHFAFDAKCEIRRVVASDTGDWSAVEDILYKLIRSSINHARSQVNGRKPGTMTYEQALELIRSGRGMVTRPGWSILGGLRVEDDGELFY